MEAVTLRGPFDLPAAIALQARLKNTPAEGALRVDFSDAEVTGVALAGLGAWLKSCGRKVLAVGLRDGEVQLLHFLGYGAAFACER
ncbi:MAG TPA: hypothetical protein VFA20_34930 [Myxococcaceae bacterium]|nr:hypothetical protein [Myxococcaceae bacterium]